MGLLSDVLLFPITGPAKGLIFVLEQIRDLADAELHEDARLRDQLVLLHVRYELGEISEREFAVLQDALLDRLNAVRHDSEDVADNTTPDRDERGR